MYNEVCCNKIELEYYLKRLTYIPENWELDKLLEKKISSLSNIELQRLITVFDNEQKADILNKYIEIINEQPKTKYSIYSLILSKEEQQELEAIAKSFNLEKIALIKLNKQELKEIENIISQFDGTNEVKITSMINNIKNEFAKEYAFEYFGEYKINFLVNKLSKRNNKSRTLNITKANNK